MRRLNMIRNPGHPLSLPLRLLIAFSLLLTSAPGLAAPECARVFSESSTDFPWHVFDQLALAKNALGEGYGKRWGRNEDPGHPVMDELRARHFGTASRNFLARFSNNSVQLLLGLPPPFRSQLGQVLRKVWDDPKAVLSDQEWSLIEQAGLIDKVQSQREFSLENPHWRRARLVKDRTGALLMAFVFLLAAKQAYDSTENLWDEEEFALLSLRPSEEPIVHLLIETVPFPHLALRIDSQVYSYGFDQLSSVGIAQYFGDGVEPFSSKNSSLMENAISSETARNASMTDRVVRVVELKLSRAEANELRQDLERSKGQHYRNVTLINDCSTMIFRALARHTDIRVPSFIDPFPTTVALYLTLLKSLGSKRVGQQGLVVQKKGSLGTLVARNSQISLLEARLMISGLFFDVGSRALFDARNSEASLQWRTPEELAQIEEWKAEARKRIEADLQGLDSRRRSAFIEFERAKIQKLLDRPTAEFYDVIRAEAQLDFLATLSRTFGQSDPTKFLTQ